MVYLLTYVWLFGIIIGGVCVGCLGSLIFVCCIGFVCFVLALRFMIYCYLRSITCLIVVEFIRFIVIYY